MLTIATWNLENFFRPGADAGPTSQAAYDDKVAHLKATIEAIAPDVLGVQEVGQPGALEDLRVALGADWHAITSEHPDGRGALEHEMGRGALRVRVAHNGTSVDLVCCHLKSKLLSFPGPRPGTTSFNPTDEAAAATTQMLLGPPGSQIGTGGCDHPDAGDGMRLWNLAPGNVPTVGVHHQATGSIGIDPLQRRDAPASDYDPVYAHLDI